MSPDEPTWSEVNEIAADALLDRAIAAWKASLAVPDPDAMWENIRRRMEPPPSWLLVGTLSNPIVAANGEFAWWSTVDELIGTTEGE